MICRLLFTQYYWNDKIKDNNIVGPDMAHGRDENYTQGFCWKTCNGRDD